MPGSSVTTYPGRIGNSPARGRYESRAWRVATGGMEKRAVGTALCPYPLGRHQLNGQPGPHSAEEEALNTSESRDDWAYT
jgi:hypothetical protein